MLRVQIRSMTYPNGYQALHAIDYTFPDRGMIAIVGESGCGKSTLIQCISGMQAFDGELYYGGQEIDEQVRERFMREQVAFVFQDDRLFGSLTTADNVALGAEAAGKEISPQRTQELLEQVGIARYRDTAARLLSGGEKQRAAIARALAKDAEILVEDEPTGNLDRRNSAHVMELLRQIAREKLVIVVTHDRNAAMTYADRIVYMQDGSLVQTDEIVQAECMSHSVIPASARKAESRKRCRLRPRVFVRLAFLRTYGSRLWATALLCIVVGVLAILSTMFAGQNKITLTERALAGMQGGSQVEFWNETGQTDIPEVKIGPYTTLTACKGWKYVLPESNIATDFWTYDAKAGDIAYCIEQGEYDPDLQYIYGHAPQSLDQAAIPKSVAELLDPHAGANIVGKTVTVCTGQTERSFVISGVYGVNVPAISEKYAALTPAQIAQLDAQMISQLQNSAQHRHDATLNRAIVVAHGARSAWQAESTQEQYVVPAFTCSKGTWQFTIYNAAALGVDVPQGSVMLSPYLDSMLRMMYAQEFVRGKLELTCTADEWSETVAFAPHGTYAPFGGQLAMVWNEQDYRSLVQDASRLYQGVMVDTDKQSIAAWYDELQDISPDTDVYMMRGYRNADFMATVQIAQDVSLPILAPIAAGMWGLFALSVYVMIRNLTVAGRKNILILRLLGMDRTTFRRMAVLRSGVCVVIVAGIAIACGAIAAACIAAADWFYPSLFAFVGWEFLGLALSAIVGCSVALLRAVREVFSLPPAQAYTLGKDSERLG